MSVPLSESHSGPLPVPENVLRRLLDAAENGLAFCEVSTPVPSEPDFVVRLTNRTFRDQLGIAEAHSRHYALSPHFALIPGTDVLDRLTEASHTGREISTEWVQPLPNAPRRLRMTASPYAGGLLLSLTDLTRQPVQIQQQALYLRQLLQTSPCGVIAYEAVRDPAGALTDFRTVFCNKAYQQQVSLPESTIHRLTLRERFPDSFFPGLFELYVRLVQTGEPLREERYYAHLDTWFDVSFSKLNDGFLLATYDITALKKAQLEVQQQASLLDGVLSNSLHSLSAYEAIRDAQGTIVDFRITLSNPATLALFPKTVWPNPTLDALRQMTHLQLFPHTREDGLFRQLVEVVETGSSTRFSKDYPEHEVSLEYSINKFGDGLIIGIIDLTAIRNYQFQLESTNAALRHSNESLQQFAYVASHDLQEPLRKIQAFGDILVSRYAPQLEVPAQDLVQRMQQAAARMTSLIQDLLAYSRVTIQQQAFEPVNLDALTADVLNDLEVVIREKNARIDVAPLPTLPGDRLQLRQLLQNLLTNALKFTPPGVTPHVRITSERVTHRTEARLPRSRQVYQKICVIDNGIGIGEQYVERIFQLFQRLHRRQEYSGTGIGLAICKKVVDNHHGHIWVNSQPGEGATFCVCLPEGKD